MLLPAEQQRSPQVQKKALGISPSANLLNKLDWPETAEGTWCRISEPFPAEAQSTAPTPLFLCTEMVFLQRPFPAGKL